MIKAFGKLNSDPHYSCCDLCEQCQDELSCCVLNPEEKESRFCDPFPLRGSDPNPLDCPTHEEMYLAGSNDAAITVLSRWIRWMLRIQFILLIIPAVMMLFLPRAVVFNAVINDQYRRYFVDDELDKLTAEQESLKTAAESANAKSSGVPLDISLTGAFSKFLTKYLENPDTTPDEREELLEQIKQVKKKQAEQHPEEVAIMAPTQLLGSAYLFFVIYSLIHLMNDIDLHTFPFSVNLIWYICTIVGLFASMSIRGEGLASSAFTISLTVFSILMLVVWGYIERKVSRFQRVVTEDLN